MKKYKAFLVGLIVLNVTLISVILFYLFVFRIDANKVYNDSIQSIVEVKAVKEDIGESFGTGEIIKSDGTIITNAHVVTYTRLSIANEFDNYYIRFANEEDYREVYLIKYDSDLDLAVLKLDDVKVKVLKTTDSSKINSGDKVYAIGNTSNKGIGISKGIISVPLVNIIYEEKTRAVIQCDLTIAQGNSGGALLNEKGKLIGITTFRTKDNLGNVIYGIVYCIPINIVLDYIKWFFWGGDQLRKRITILTSLALTFVLIIVGIFSINYSNSGNNQLVRSVELNNNSLVDDSYFNAFDSYDLIIQDNKSTFDGFITINLAELAEIDNVTSSDILNDASLKFSSTFDYDTGTSTLNVYVIDENEEVTIIDTIYGVALLAETGEVDV